MEMNLNKNVTVKPEYKWDDKNILIAEDEDLNYRLLVEILRKTKAQIIRAVNGVEAVEICKNKKENDIDLILMDIRMPEMNGFEAAKKIKAFRKEVPIIAQTAYSITSDFVESMEAGCDDYIAKPIKVSQFLSIISKYISES